MRYFWASNNYIFCIQASALVRIGILKKHQYEYMTQCGHLRVVRIGCRNTSALVEWDSMPDRLKAEVRGKIGDPRKIAPRNALREFIANDVEALGFFQNYRLADGTLLMAKNADRVWEYYANARVLNAAGAMLSDRRGFRRARGSHSSVNIWNDIADAANSLDRRDIPHSLPAHPAKLRLKWKEYTANGGRNYGVLIHKNFCNANARKVTGDVERLLLSIFVMENKPYGAWVHEYYHRFLGGVLDIADMKTGELFKREDFKNDKGEYIEISGATAWNYLNNPKNKAITDSIRMDGHRFRHIVRPHRLMYKPKMSLSMASADDVDLSRLLHKVEGQRKRHVFAYYIYDVASGALIGAAYSREKDEKLLMACVIDMFKTLEAAGMGCPIEIQVEHHLWSKLKDGLAKEGALFKYVTFCAAQNSQQKYAEHFNRIKKYCFEKRHHAGVGRHYAKSEANHHSNHTRAYDAEAGEYVFEPNKSFSYEELVADDREVIAMYNGGKVKWDAKKRAYEQCGDNDAEGRTRWQVFLENANPDAPKIDKALVARYAGESRVTTINRNMWCSVNYTKYVLDSGLIEKLHPNNYNVTAYWIPDEAGEVDSVYLWQNDKYIGEAKSEHLYRYQVSRAERTEADEAKELLQTKYVAKFDRMVKEGAERLAAAHFVGNIEAAQEAEAQEIVYEPPPQKGYLEREAERYEQAEDEEFEAARAMENL